MNSFVGLRGGNALLVKSGETLHSKVVVKRQQGCRIVSEAKYEITTRKVVKVLMLAQKESRRLGHNLIGTEQILLGLIGEETGNAAKVLKSMGINLKDARIEVEKIIGKGSGSVAVRIPYSCRAKRVLELSREEAHQLGRNCIDTEHLLLGLLRGGESVATRVLQNLGADPNNIYLQVFRMRGWQE
uniref:Putative ovule protein n=1 Tax=Solanum chacoense TaxID=4108 RepID=A0A0V0HCS6_SOLCH